MHRQRTQARPHHGGKSFECDLLLLCTGQQPNSSLMAKLSPSSVDPGSRLVRVHRTLQVAVPDPRDAAQQPFDAKPPCGDCDCFLDKKAHVPSWPATNRGILNTTLAARLGQAAQRLCDW